MSNLLNDQQWKLVDRIDCALCSDNIGCDRIKVECPKVNFSTLQVDDVSILREEKITEKELPKEAKLRETTKHDFSKHLYGNIFRCRFSLKTLSFFSSEKEASGFFLFFFMHRDRYFMLPCDSGLSDEYLDNLIMSKLYPEKKSFNYQGWLCKYDKKKDVFQLFTPDEVELEASFRNCEFEVDTPMQAIQFINSY